MCMCRFKTVMGSFGGLGTRVELAGATFRSARTSNVGQYMEGSPSYERC